MCNLYAQTKGPAAIRDLVRAVRDFSGNLEPQPAIFPDQMAPVVRTDPMGDWTIILMRWGFPPPSHLGTKTVVTNVRNTNSSWWKPYLRPEFRCLVPVTSFSEYDHILLETPALMPVIGWLESANPRFLS